MVSGVVIYVWSFVRAWKDSLGTKGRLCATCFFEVMFSDAYIAVERWCVGRGVICG